MQIVQSASIDAAYWLDLAALPADGDVVILTVANPNDAGGGYTPAGLAVADWVKTDTVPRGAGSGCFETWRQAGPFSAVYAAAGHPNGIQFHQGRAGVAVTALAVEESA